MFFIKFVQQIDCIVLAVVGYAHHNGRICRKTKIDTVKKIAQTVYLFVCYRSFLNSGEYLAAAAGCNAQIFVLVGFFVYFL